MNIVISGISGFIGSSLKNHFLSLGWTVQDIPRQYLYDDTFVPQLVELLISSDIVINLRGASVAGRWTSSYMQKIYDSRIRGTQALVKAMKETGRSDIVFISASAVGIYEAGLIHDETSTYLSKGFLGKVCIDWEREALAAETSGIRTLIFRSGVVLGSTGGVVKKLKPLFRMGLGAVILPASDPFPWIHIDDWIQAVIHGIHTVESRGIYNLSASETTSQRDFAMAFARSVKRPLLFVLPKFMLRMILGRGAEFLNNNPFVIPARLRAEGFQFRYKDIHTALYACNSNK